MKITEEIILSQAILVWMIVIALAMVSAIVPIVGPAFLGLVIYELQHRPGRVQKNRDILLPALLGIGLFTLFIQALYSGQSVKLCLVVLLGNSIAFLGVLFAIKFMKHHKA
ncbi:TPA: hypothetical protein DCZ15_03225 [Candidatus Falkowbacteria bacterium]|nr:MAG: hypothetical protein UV95_C0002G0031 [Candidatus Falkowbacteria bacterium GW2011_GWF2_43_32]HBA36861.1 hypothetical protein [Candidatus Falkowbacteria bacterium]